MEQKQYIKKRFSKSNEADLWKNMYRHPESAFHYHMILRRDNALEQIMKLTNCPTILDLGCGAGPLLGPLNDLSFNIVGIDISHDMLLHSLGSSETDVSPIVIQGNSEALPFPDNHFDVVVSLGMFGYVENVTGALSEIKRILKPDGKFIFSVRNRFHQILFDPCKLARFTYNKTLSLIKKAFNPNPRLSALPDNNLHQIDHAERGFLIDIFDNPYKVIRTVTNSGFQFENFEGLGYGPFSFCEHELLSGKGSIATSKFIESILRKSRIHKLTRWVSDVSVYTFSPT